MGRLRFYAPGQEALIAYIAPRGYVAGLEGIPWETVCVAEGEQLAVDRDTGESGTFAIPWPVPQRGELMLTTSNLMERADPYLLPLELARGTINKLRNQAASWQLAGLKLDAGLEQRIHVATEALAHSATRQHEPAQAAQLAEKAIQLAVGAIDQLGDLYSEQALKLRRESGPLPTLLAVRLQEPPEGKAVKKILGAFNSVVVPFTWRTVESSSGARAWDQWDRLIDWANDQGLKVCGGPLIQLDRLTLPDWIYLWDEDWEELESYILGHVAAVVERYRSRVHLWNIAGRVNIDPALGISEEQLLRLTVDAIESLRTIDPRTPSIVSFDQPWSEHLAAKDRDLPPMHFADTLARAELGVAGFGLEMNWGYWPQGTPPRDAIEVSRLVDRWTSLGHPLLISLTAPSEARDDPQAFFSSPKRGQDSHLAWQQFLVEHIVPVLMAKNSVQAIVWNQWTDIGPHEFAHSGLIDAAGRAKPALKTLSEIKQKYLG